MPKRYLWLVFYLWIHNVYADWTFVEPPGEHSQFKYSVIDNGIGIALNEEVNEVITIALIDGLDSAPTISKVSSSTELDLGIKTLQDNGQWAIQIQNKIDFESASVDGTDPTFRYNVLGGTLTQSLAINIKNINDNAPTVASTAQGGRCKFEENKTGTTDCKFEITDADGFTVGQHSYEVLEDNNLIGKFSLEDSPDNPSSVYKKIMVLKVRENLDFEDKFVYSLTVKAKDDDLPEAISPFVLEVQDLPDMPPYWKSLPPYTTLDEDQETVIQLEAADGDRGLNAPIGYETFYDFDNLNFFSFDTETGLLTVNKIDVDEVQKNEFKVTVTAYEKDDSTSRINGSIIIIINDVNDNVPTITPSSVDQLSIDETFTSTLDVNIQIKDPDLGTSGQFEIFLESSPMSDAFLIVPSTGYQSADVSISVVDASFLDYDDEALRNFELKVIARELADPSHTASIVIPIQLNNVFDEVPIFSEPVYEVHMNENPADKQDIITVTATDRDVDDELTYGIKPDDVEIDNQGKITVKISSSFDYERMQEMSFQISVTDKGGNKAFAELKITIDDVNDTPPRLILPRIKPVVQEDAELATIFDFEISATDLDSNADLDIRINWDSTTATKTNMPVDSAFFQGVFSVVTELEGQGTKGKLSLSKALDWETFDVIFLEIEVEDKNTDVLYPDASLVAAEMIIYINDTNDNPPVFDEEVYTFEVTENARKDQLIGIIHAKDDDGVPFNKVTYSLSPSDNLVKIDPTTGQLLVDSDGTIDCEENVELTYVATASDGDNSATSNIVIKVRDVNDNDPVLQEILPSSRPKIFENAATGVLIATIFANDSDIEEPHNVLMYEIDFVKNPIYQDFFEIDKESGELKVKLADGRYLDREATPEGYDVTIIVRDNYAQGITVDSRSITVDLHIDLEDVNDVNPYFPEEMKPDSASETTKQDTGIYQFCAYDDDLGINKELTFEISRVINSTQDVVEGLFGVRGTTLQDCGESGTAGEIFAAIDLLDKWDSYTVQLQATDGGDPSLSSEIKDVTIIILDENDNAPDIKYPEDNETIYISNVQTLGEALNSYKNYSKINPVRAEDNDDYGNGNGKVIFSVEGEFSNIFDFKMRDERNQADLILISEMPSTVIDSTFPITIRARDNATLESSQKQVDVQVTLYVYVTEELEPEFPSEYIGQCYNVNFTETEIGLKESWFLPKATDINNINRPDDIFEEDIYFYLIGPDSEYFSLNSTTGELTLHSELDHEHQTEHKIYVVTTNSEENPGVSFDSSNSSHLCVDVQVNDVKDTKPTFKDSVYAGGFANDDIKGKEIMKIYGVDPDENDPLHYTIVGGSMSISDPSLDEYKDKAFKLAQDNSIATLYLDIDPAANKLNLKGVFKFQVEVQDSTGLPENREKTDVQVYIITENNRITFQFGNPVDEVTALADDIPSTLSSVLNYSCGIDKVQKASSDAANKTNVIAHFINTAENMPVEKEEIVRLLLSNEVIGRLQGNFSQKSLWLQNWLDGSSPATQDMQGIIQTVLIVVSSVLALLVIVLFTSFFYKTKKLQKRIEGMTDRRFGSQDSGLNRLGMPNTNKHTVEGSNPVWNGDANDDSYPNYDNSSQGSGDSDMIGIENQPQFQHQGHGTVKSNYAIEIPPPRRGSLNPLANIEDPDDLHNSNFTFRKPDDPTTEL